MIQRKILFSILIGMTPVTAPAGTLESPQLKWAYGGCYETYCPYGWYGSPAVGDIDDDPQPEVVWGAYDVVALSGSDGGLEWRVAGGTRVWGGVALADLDGNNSLEIVVGRGNNLVDVYTDGGGVVWSVAPFADGDIRTLAVVDLETDGKLEVVAARAAGTQTDQVQVLDFEGNVRNGWPARAESDPGYGFGIYNHNVAVADLDGNGLKELIAPNDTSYLMAMSHNGDQLPANEIYGVGKVWNEVVTNVDHEADLRGYTLCETEYRGNFAYSAAAIADLDGDGSLEIVVPGNVYDCEDAYVDQYRVPWIFNPDRSRWNNDEYDWTVLPVPGPGSGPLELDFNVIESSFPNTALADLDGDGEMEILMPSYDGKLHAWWLDKTEHGNWPFTVAGAGDDYRFAGEPVVVDLDGDGRAEVLFTSWPRKNGDRNGKLHMLDYQGNPVFELDLPAARGLSWNGGLGAPTLADIDGDEDLELVIGTVSSGVVAYDLPNSASARVLWGTGRGSFGRIGLAMPQRLNQVFSDGFEGQTLP